MGNGRKIKNWIITTLKEGGSIDIKMRERTNVKDKYSISTTINGQIVEIDVPSLVNAHLALKKLKENAARLSAIHLRGYLIVKNFN